MDYKISAKQIEDLVNGLKAEVAKSDKGVRAAQTRYRRKLSEIITLAKSLRARSLGESSSSDADSTQED